MPCRNCQCPECVAERTKHEVVTRARIERYKRQAECKHPNMGPNHSARLGGGHCPDCGYTWEEFPSGN